MTIKKDDLTLEQVNKVLKYNEHSGELTWISKESSRSVVVDTRAGTKHKNGYRYIQLYGNSYPEHRLIWFIKTGNFPSGVIDHINHKRDDNRWSNLRDVSFSENMRNQTVLKGTRTGEQGIWYCKRRKRYIAELTYEGKKVMQRSFINFDEAKEAREKLMAELGFHHNHGK